MRNIAVVTVELYLVLLRWRCQLVALLLVNSYLIVALMKPALRVDTPSDNKDAVETASSALRMAIS